MELDSRFVCFSKMPGGTDCGVNTVNNISPAQRLRHTFDCGVNTVNYMQRLWCKHGQVRPIDCGVNTVNCATKTKMYVYALTVV